MNVRASVDSAATTVGGRLQLTLEVVGAQNWKIAPPEPGAELGSFVIRSVTPKNDSSQPAFELGLIALKPGEQEIPPVTLEAHTPPDRDTTITSSPIRVLVRTNLEPAEAASESTAAQAPLAADKPALEAPRDWVPVWIALGALALGTLLGVLLWRKLRHRRPRPAAPIRPAPLEKKKLRPAWEIALEELERIDRSGHVERGELKMLYVEVTEALRRYFEDRYGIPALESTTDELRPRLDEISLDTMLASRTLAILQEADLVKFAKARPEATAARTLLPRVRELIMQTIPKVPEGAAP
jgi:hypothetical protein